MATNINGAKIRFYMDGNIEPASINAEEWKQRLESQNIDLAGRDFTVSGLMGAPLHSENFEYYMKRNNKFYFRGVGSRVVVTLGDPSVLAELEYHDRVNLNWDIADTAEVKIIEEATARQAVLYLRSSIKEILSGMTKDSEPKS